MLKFDVNSWRGDLARELVAKEADGGFKKGTVTTFLKQLAEKHEINYSSLNSAYYTYVKRMDELKKVLAQNGTDEKGKKKAVKKKDTKVNRKEKNTQEPSVSSPVLVEKEQSIPSQPNNVETGINQSDLKLLNSFRTPATRPTKPPYKVGDLLELEIVAIEGYGAFAKTLDGWEYDAIIHKSETINGYVTDVTRYFKVGDKVTAMFKSMRWLKDQTWRVECSTRSKQLWRNLPDYDIPEHTAPKLPEPTPLNNTALADQLSQVVNKIELAPEKKQVQVQQKEVVLTQQQQHIVAQHQEQNKQEVKDNLRQYVPDNAMLDEIVTYMCGIVGVVSQEAQTKLRNIIKEQGVFKFTLAMSKIAEGFKVPDVGLMFLNMVEGEMGNRL